MKINDLSYNATDARYGYNGTHEQDKELNADGNYLDFGNFGYDTRVAMRRNQEPLSMNTPSKSNYIAFNCNPILYKDIDGNKWKVFSSTKDGIDRLKTYLTKCFDGKVLFTIQNDIVSMALSSPDIKLNQTEQALFDVLEEATDLDTRLITHQVYAKISIDIGAYAMENVKTGKKANDPNPNINIGYLDISDLEIVQNSLPQNLTNAFIGHEVYEQFRKFHHRNPIFRPLDYKIAHGDAIIYAEDKISGYIRISESEDKNSRKILYQTSGSPFTKFLYDLGITIVGKPEYKTVNFGKDDKGNIINVKIEDGDTINETK